MSYSKKNNFYCNYLLEYLCLTLECELHEDNDHPLLIFVSPPSGIVPEAMEGLKSVNKLI